VKDAARFLTLIVLGAVVIVLVLETAVDILKGS